MGDTRELLQMLSDTLELSIESKYLDDMTKVLDGETMDSIDYLQGLMNIKLLFVAIVSKNTKEKD